MSNKNIWYLPGPFHQYKENVKALAKEAGLRIIDANATESRDDQALEVPEVTLHETPCHVVIVDGGSFEQLQELIERLNIERDLIVALIESAEGLAPLVHPEAGELPIRLFDALTAIHDGVTSLRSQLDGETDKAEALQKQVDDLLAQAAQARLETEESKEAKEVAELKAKLEAANVTYRANASKDSLEKLVAELPAE